MVVVLLIIFAVVFFILFLHAWLFVIMGGSQPSGKSYDDFVLRISSPKGFFHFAKTIFTLGYFEI